MLAELRRDPRQVCGELADPDLAILIGPFCASTFWSMNRRSEKPYSPRRFAAACAGILAGAHIVRVHDVREIRAAADVADEILQGNCVG